MRSPFDTPGEGDGPTWCLYVVRCSDSTLYTGISTDVCRRVHEHNNTKRGAKYTRSRRPVHLLCFWTFPDLGSAARAEREFKNLSRSQKLAYVSARVNL